MNDNKECTAGHKECNKCHLELPLSSFSVDNKRKDGLQYTCKPCAAAYRQTLTGCLSHLVSSAKQHANRLGTKKGREEAGVFEITPEDLEQKFEEQDGKCFYSGIPLQTDTRAWRPSLERKDPSKGYTYDNTVLCCVEFNSRCQWTPKEIRRLVDMVLMKEQGRDHVEMETFDIAETKRRGWTKGEEKSDGGNILHKCMQCTEYKPASMFNKEISQGCKACRSKKSVDYRATPRVAMQQLVNRARYRTNNWKKKNDPRGGDADFELSLDLLIKRYNKQGGRCAYSGLPFDFGTQRRKPSLEREDPLKPYTEDNICLIWMAWNTIDRAADTKHGVKPGDQQGWSKPKFLHAFSHIESKTKKEFEDAHGGPMTMDEFKTRISLNPITGSTQ